MEDVVCVGDLVCLYCEEARGYMFNFTSSSVHNGVLTFSDQDREKPLNITDPQGITFEIELKNRYKFQKRLRNCTDANSLDVKKAAEAEEAENVTEQERQRGGRLRYGQTIQLKHQFTGKYVHISTTRTSKSIRNYMAVELHSYNDKHAQFKILPKFKVKSEGDLVQVNDQIVLESVKSPMQFLQASPPAVIDFTGACFHNTDINKLQFCEVNLGVYKSGFTLVRYRKHDSNNNIKGGAIVRLLQKEQDAYLVARGYLNNVTEQCHLRSGGSDPNHPKTLYPSTSGVTFWQLENLDSILNGSAVKWEQHVLLRHMVTRHYVAVNESGELVMTRDRNHPDVVFRLHPVIRATEDIEFGSYTRIQHVLSGKWLHATAETFESKSQTAKQGAMLQLNFDIAAKKVVRAEAICHYDDAFTLQEVSQMDWEQFNFFAGMMAPVLKLKNSLKHHEMSPHDVMVSKGMLDEQADHLVVHETPNDAAQKLFRNLMIVDKFIKILQFDDMNKFGVDVIFERIYNLLKNYLKGNNRKNELYIVRHMEVFTRHISKQNNVGKSALAMVTELVRDNWHIVDIFSMEPDKDYHISYYVKLLEDSMDYRYLEMLSVFCTCDGMTLSDNQTFIAREWLKPHNNCIYLTEKGDRIHKDPDTWYLSTDNSRTWKPLSECQKGDPSEYLFLQHQLQLFAKLCSGRNQYAIDLITKQLGYITKEEAIHCLQDTDLPGAIRAIYCELMVKLFVDVDDHQPVMDQIILSTDTANEPETKPSLMSISLLNYRSSVISRVTRKSATGDRIAPLSKWIPEFLGDSHMEEANVDANKLIEQVLHLLYYVVTFGKFTENDDASKNVKVTKEFKEQLKDPLLSLLKSGSHLALLKTGSHKAKKVTSKVKHTDRFQPAPEIQAFLDAKYRALEVVELLLESQFNEILVEFLQQFKVLSTKNDPMSESDFKRRVHKFLEQAMDKKHHFKPVEIRDILLDLCGYQYEKMTCKSIKLLTKLYSQIENMFAKAIQIPVLVIEESSALNKYVKDHIGTIHRLSEMKLNTEQARALCEILDELASYCFLEDDPEEVHDINQVILINLAQHFFTFRVLSMLMEGNSDLVVFGICLRISGLSPLWEDVVALWVKVFAFELLRIGGVHLFVSRIPQIVKDLLTQGIGEAALEQPTLRSVMAHALELLRVLVKRNPTVQKFTFGFCEKLLQIQGLECQAATCVMEVFTGNLENCLTLGSNLIQRIVDLAAQFTEEVPEFLDLLCAIVKIEELNEPLKRNQDLVMKFIMQSYDKIGFLFDSDQKERERILPGESDPKRLNYLISFVDLMANCAEGDNHFTECWCQSLLPIEDILEVLTRDDLDHTLKRPYLKLLLWAHVHTSTGITEMANGLPENMCSYLGSLSVEAKKLTQYVKAHPDVTTNLLKKPPSKRAVSTSPEDQAYGSIHYFIDAVLPFVGVLFTKINLGERSGTFQTNSAKLAVSLFDFAESVTHLICNKHQLAAVYVALGVLVNLVENTEHYKNIARQAKQHLKNNLIAVNQSREIYNDKYQVEIELKKTFCVFTKLFQEAYRGGNNKLAQLDDGNMKDDDAAKAGAGLPLGPEFQGLVDYFTQDSYKHAEQLLEQLHISSSYLATDGRESPEQVEVDIKCLQILRALIYNEQCKVNTKSSRFKGENTDENREVTKVQDIMVKQHAVTKTMALLQSSNGDIIREYFAFTEMLLLHANTSAQTAFKESFYGTREESFFFVLKERIQMSAYYIKEKRLLLAQNDAKKQREIALTDIVHDTVQHGSDEKKTKKRWFRVRKGVDKESETKNIWFRMKEGVDEESGDEEICLEKKEVVDKKNEISVDRNNNRNTRQKKPEGTGTDVSKNDLDSLDLQDFKDQGYIGLMLRMMASMCDGQNAVLQDYMREQPDNYKSANLVADTTNFLGLLYSHIDSHNIALVTQIFTTLNELASGNLENQAVIYEHHIVEYVNYILRETFKKLDIKKVDVKEKKDADQDGTLLKLWSAIGYLLMSMMEEVRPETRQQLVELCNILDMENLTKIAVECHRTWPKQTEVGFQYFFLLMKLKDLGAVIKEYTDYTQNTSEEYYAFLFYRDNHKSVEILKDNHIQVVRFRLRDKKALREKVKEKLKWNIDRTAPTNKLRDFNDWSNDILMDIKHQQYVQKLLPVRFFINRWEFWNNLAFLLSLVICILMLVSWKAKASLADVDMLGEDFLMAANSSLYDPTPEYPDWFGMALTVLGSIHFVTSFIILIVYMSAGHAQIYPVISITKWYRETTLFGFKTSTQNFQKQHKSQLFVEVFSFRTVYQLLFIAFSGLGLKYHGYFYGFHLLNIAYSNQVLTRVILAVTLNGRALCWVALLGLIIIFQFSLIAFAYFRYAMDPNGEESTLYCGDLNECTVTLIRYGLVGDLFEKMAIYQSGRSFNHFGVLVGYHIAFFILITTVGLNIVFGIILDTFSELRLAKCTIEKDMKELCFICSQPSHLFENSNSKGFSHHVKNDHNMWAYMYFFIHLNETPKCDQTHLELYVTNLKDKQSYDYFPLNRALGLVQDTDKQDEKLDEVLSKVRALIERSDKEDAMRERKQERQRQERWENEHRQASLDTQLVVDKTQESP